MQDSTPQSPEDIALEMLDGFFQTGLLGAAVAKLDHLHGLAQDDTEFTARPTLRQIDIVIWNAAMQVALHLLGAPNPAPPEAGDDEAQPPEPRAGDPEMN